jgi:hypothetical protein
LALSALRNAPKPIDKTLTIIKHFSDNHIRDFHRELGNFDRMPPSRLMSLAATDKSWARNFMDDHPFLQKIFRVVSINSSFFLFSFGETKALPYSN